MSGRRSYRRLSALPAFGLYLGDKLVATVAAESALAARKVFKDHQREYGYTGDRVRRLG